MDRLLALIAFSVVSTVTPGPNNVLLWASGAQFGFRRTVPHILGTAVGVGLLAVAAAIGLGVVISGVPALALAMKVAGSVYLVYLGYRVAGASAFGRGDIARPLGVVQAAALQLVNPKVWVFALGSVTAFRISDPGPLGVLLVPLTMMAIVVPTAALWAVGGDALGRLLAGPRTRRATSLVLAAMVMASVASVWL